MLAISYDVHPHTVIEELILCISWPIKAIKYIRLQPYLPELLGLAQFLHYHLIFLPSLSIDESSHICLILQPAPLTFSIANIPFLTPPQLHPCALNALV